MWQALHPQGLIQQDYPGCLSFKVLPILYTLPSTYGRNTEDGVSCTLKITQALGRSPYAR